ncbi:MAG: hypothetical protein LBM02_03175 [Lachnospiraceae bacterium]|jgi:uncharacterized protein YdeI (BOF family)|nr:hypothetical protein [Lachnospiraceae bacterium]
MKKFFLITLFAILISCAMPAQSGYVGPGPKVQTIEEVKKLRDDTPVTLIGIIER